MQWKRQTEPGSQPVVDWMAGQIHDPLAKLRFLKVAAPRHQMQPRKYVWFRRYALFLIPFVFAVIFLVKAKARVEPAVPQAITVPLSHPAGAAGPPPAIWQVEKTADYEVYSNGLRIETRYEVGTHPRHYLAFPAGAGKSESQEQRTVPAGIVFHATESRQAPFEESENRVLRRLGESALDYVRRKRAYHFVIDRFGRVYRVVRETDAANHAGYSIWADERWVYINLNESFLGISFEAASGESEETAPGPAQQRAAAVLVEMLRYRYQIPAANCVTHAQVSVNPDNLRVGYHTDWAAGFPFESIGLPNNYEQPLTAVARFGFACDPAFLDRAAAALRSGAQAGEGLLLRHAAEKRAKPSVYRLELHHEYRDLLARVKRYAAEAAARPEAASAIQ